MPTLPRTALPLVAPALAALVAGCGGSPAMTTPMPDLGATATMMGLVGGELPVVLSTHYGADTSCGTKGIVVHFAETTDGGCGTDATSKRNVRIYLSDFLPSTFTRTTSTACPSQAGAKEFFATFHSNEAGDFDSFKGGVTVNLYDPTSGSVGGVFDITFSSRDTPGFDNGHFYGSFLSHRCE